MPQFMGSKESDYLATKPQQLPLSPQAHSARACRAEWFQRRCSLCQVVPLPEFWHQLLPHSSLGHRWSCFCSPSWTWAFNIRTNLGPARGWGTTWNRGHTSSGHSRAAFLWLQGSWLQTHSKPRWDWKHCSAQFANGELNKWWFF